MAKNIFLEPKTNEEFEHNVQFQLDNVNGWVGSKKYESALIKAECLVEALQELINSK